METLPLTRPSLNYIFMIFGKRFKTTTRYMLLQYTKPSVKTGLIFGALKMSKYLGNSMKNISQSPINLP